MARERRKMEEINASSMADIAFLLLIFFLVTTTMNVDLGLPRLLPPMPKSDQKDEIQDYKERNVLLVRINRSDKLLVAGRPMDLSELKDKAKEFIANPQNSEELPEKKMVEVPLLGEMPVTKGVISLQNDRATTYKAYLAVQNELIAAYNELRNGLAMQHFGHPFDQLDGEEKRAIQKAIPQRISEAEPVGVKKKGR
ncbi:MAG: biopolymer transporter ExbD [Bacteroidetes bacterium]|nr:MAG: biopolymer transporter ExbD [Bacteroidota bacterium]